MSNKVVNTMSAYVLILIITFTNVGSTGVTASTVQVEHKSLEACQEMLKGITTGLNGMNSNVRHANCYKR